MTYMCQREKKKVEDRGWGVCLAPLLLSVSKLTALKKKKRKKKMLLECDGRRLLTFSPLFSYQMLGRKKRGRQESALSGKPGH